MPLMTALQFNNQFLDIVAEIVCLNRIKFDE